MFSKRQLAYESGDDLVLLLLVNALADGAMQAYRVAVCRGEVTEEGATSVANYLEGAAKALRANGHLKHGERFQMTAAAIREQWRFLENWMHGFAVDYSRDLPFAVRRRKVEIQSESRT